MKKIITICAIALSLGVAANAQKPENNFDNKKHQAVESEKIAFLTRTMDITPEEAGPFWALYNKYEKMQAECFKTERDAFKALNSALKDENVKDSEIDNLIKAYLAAKQNNIDVHAKHAAEYKKIVGPRKTAKFFCGQERFRRQQINKLRGNQHKPGMAQQKSGFNSGRPGQKAPSSEPAAPTSGK